MGLLDGTSRYNASCGRTTGLVWNLTSSYADQSNEASMVSASVIMFVLAALFFNLNLFSGLSDVSAILDPKVRAVLSKALALFLPVMSYLFSEAKNAGLVCSTASAVSVTGPAELPLRARLILTWMLLVELLRNKVEEIRMHGQGWHAGTAERAGRVAWLGSLVFFNLHGAGRKSVFGILWLLCAAKLVQKFTFTEVGKSSFAYGKNARLVISYMAQVLHKDEQAEAEHLQHGGDELLKWCKYVVMGEDKLVIKATSDGYELAGGDDDTANGAAVVTVGKIWKLAAEDCLFTSLDKDQRLRRLCLSFALFKLLRRSFEHLPATSELETRNCRDLIFKGLYNDGGQDQAEIQKRKNDQAEALFQVMKDETIFLSEYYHSVVPVVLASPFFLLANYVLLPLVVLVLCLVIIVLCGNGDVLFAFQSMESDNYTISFGVTKMARCLLSRVTTSPSVFFSTIDFSITLLLFLVLLYEQVWEFVVFLLSNWFIVSLLYEYTAKLHWRHSPIFSWAIRRILWVRSKMSHPDLRFKQFSALRSCRISLMLPTTVSLTLPVLPIVPVPREVKHSIVGYLATSLYDDDDDTARALSNGKSAIAEHPELRSACESESVTEVILTWHIATSLFEESCPPPPHKEGAASSRDVATTLSKYCAYLVAFHPELLPDNQESTELVFTAMTEELKCKLGCWSYYFPALLGTGHAKIMGKESEATVLQKGARLGHVLESKAKCAGDHYGEGMWKVLEDLWVQLVVYAAPSRDEECVMGHKKVLPEGGEFITVLWALATHTGITRPAITLPPAAAVMERV